MPRCAIAEALKPWSRSNIVHVLKFFSLHDRAFRLSLIESLKCNRDVVEAKRLKTMPCDPKLQNTLEALETRIGYRFRDPWCALGGFVHSSYHIPEEVYANEHPEMEQRLRRIRLFHTVELIGDGAINAMTSLKLRGIAPLPSPFLVHMAPLPGYTTPIPTNTQHFLPVAIIPRVKRVLTNNLSLARVTTHLGLWDIFLKNMPGVAQEVADFQLSVKEGRYDVIPPGKIMADLLESSIGSVIADSSSFEIFYDAWLKNLFFEGNSFYLLHKRCSRLCPPVYPVITAMNTKDKNGKNIVTFYLKLNLPAGKHISVSGSSSLQVAHLAYVEINK